MGAISERAGSIALFAWVSLACNYYDFDAPLPGESEGDGTPARDAFFSEQEWARVILHSPLGETPADPTNLYADDPAAAVLGQRLYFERDYAGSRTAQTGDDGENCAGCHDPEEWFQSGGGIPDDWRNTPSVVNSAFYVWFLWDGGRDSMWAQSLGPPEQQLASTRLRVAHVLFEQYRQDYDAIFHPDLPAALDPGHPEASRFPADAWPDPDRPDDPWWSMDPADQHEVNRIFANFGKAVAAYQRRLVSRNAPFDRYVDGDHDAIDEAAKRGLRLFVGEARCAECHQGAAFTDNLFHNIGVPYSVGILGRFEAIPRVIADPFNTKGVYSDHDVGMLDGLVATDADAGKFRTKHLRQIEHTGRYMHAGQLADLHSVVDFYNDGPDAVVGTLDERLEPLGLDASEVDDLVAFLRTLTGEPVPAELRADISR